MTNLLPAEAFVLAGGQSRRFGSDKARYIIDGQPMLKRVVERLANLFGSVTVIAKEADLYADLGCPTVADHYPVQAPLAGLLTALELSGTAWTFIAACDLPALDEATIRRLWERRSGAGVIPEAGGRLHPLAAFYHQSARPHFQSAWEDERLALQSILSHPDFTQLRIADSRALENMNRPG